MWHPDLETVLDYEEIVARHLGKEVAKDLQVVVGRSGNYGDYYTLEVRDHVIPCKKTEGEV